MLKESLLAAALTFRAFHTDVETESERLKRLTTIATAIADASAQATCQGLPEEDAEDCAPLYRGNRRELAFLLLAQAYHETRLARHVHAGRCRVEIGECDGGRAISLWQLQAGAHLPEKEWETLAGVDLDATSRAALEAARALGRGLNHCRSVRGAISLYATGRTCQWDPAAERLAFTRRLLARH